MNTIRLGHTFRRSRRASAGASGNTVPYGTPPDDGENVPGAPPVPVPANPVVGLSENKAQEMYQHQSPGPTCIVASATGILRKENVKNESGELITYPDVLFKVGLVKDQTGKILHKPTLTDPNGGPLYTLTLHTDRLPKGTDISNSNALKALYVVEQGRNVNDDERYFTVTNTPDAAEHGGVFDILRHHDVESYLGYAHTVYDLVTELQRGTPIIAVVDANELWTDDYATRDESQLERVDIGGVSGTPINSGATSHQIVITSIDLSNPNKPIAVINDSGRRKDVARRIPLTQLIAAMADYRFMYIAPGTPLSALSLQQARRQTLERNLSKWYAQHAGNANLTQYVKRTEFLVSVARQPKLMQLIEKDFGGTAETAREFIAQHDRNQAALEAQFNLPEGYSDRLYSNADVLEYTKSAIQNAIENGKKSDLKNILNRELLSQVKFSQEEIDDYLNSQYLRSRGFTQDEIDEILAADSDP